MKNVAKVVVRQAAQVDRLVDPAKSEAIAEKVEQAVLCNEQRGADALNGVADKGMGPEPQKTPLRPKLEAVPNIVAEHLLRSRSLKTSTLSQPQKENPDMIRPDKSDTSKLAADTTQVGDDIAHLARAAIDAIRAATDEFASKAGISKNEAVDAVRNAGQAAVNGLGSVAGEARAITETGLDTLGKSVIRNPLAALAIAAGTGLLLGLLSRQGQDPRR